MKPGHRSEDGVGIRQRRGRPDLDRRREQPVAELVRRADRAQRRVQDRHAVAQALRLLEPVRRQEDRRAALAEVVDETVDVPSGDRVETGGRLVEEEQLRGAEERAGQGDPLAEALRQRPARVVGPIGQVDGGERLRRSRVARDVRLVQVGEALEVLADA